MSKSRKIPHGLLKLPPSVFSLLGKIKSKWPAFSKISHSQCCEDLVVDLIFRALGVSNLVYLDIGAYQPTFFSNTYYFYLKGHSGVCIDPNPSLCKEFRKERPRDVYINAGIGVTMQRQADYYIMDAECFNTFSREDAERIQSEGRHKILKIIESPLLNVNDVIGRYFQSCPNFVSIDAEGLDFEILKSFDFSVYRPEVFCVETVNYTNDKHQRKRMDSIEFMIEKGYLVYADTYINTLFVNRESWLNRA